MELVGVLVGALIAIVGGVIFRALEADHVRKQWLNDQLRQAAEQYLADINRHLDISWHRMVGEIPDGSQVIRPVTSAINIDLARLQLVAPRNVFELARLLWTKVRAAFDAAQMAGNPFDQERWKKADSALAEAGDEAIRFTDVVRRSFGK